MEEKITPAQLTARLDRRFEQRVGFRLSEHQDPTGAAYEIYTSGQSIEEWITAFIEKYDLIDLEKEPWW